jgi:virginiamycin B lyase
MRRMLNLLPLLVLAASTLTAQRGRVNPASTAPASPAPVIARVDPKEWKSPWPATDRSRDVFPPDDQGRAWFVAQQANYIAYLDTKSGEFKKYEIDAGTNPHNLVVHKGEVWFTGNRNNRLVKLDPATGKLTTYRITDSTIRDPHTMIFDKNGDAWFTAQNSGWVGRFTPSTGAFKTLHVPRTNPYGIVIDSKGQAWFDMFAVPRIGTIDPKTFTLKEYPLPDPAARPRRIGVTSDDMIWYGDYARGFLGRLNPQTGKVDEWPLPSGARSLPYGMAVDDRDYVWLNESGVSPNRLVAFDTKRLVWAEQIPIGDAANNVVRHMVFDPKTREIWYASDQGAIGRLKVPPKIIVP